MVGVAPRVIPRTDNSLELIGDLIVEGVEIDV